MARIGTAPQKAGVQTGLASGAAVMTIDGALPVEYLQPGDRIVTRQGLRTLRGVRIVEREAARAVTIRASALGHDRPGADVTVAADQPILLRDWRAKALYGSETASVPAYRLVDGEYVTMHAERDLRTYDLVFDTPQVVYVEGTEFSMPVTVEALA